MKRTLLSLFLASLPLPCLADPVISEFLASNNTGTQDEDGERGDWIEIHNPDNAPVNLSGWHLTDKSNNLNKWTFPAVSIPAKGFLLVWATEKDRTNPAGQLHTNFKLDAGGEYLALTRPDDSVAHAFSPVYPPQAPDVAYGVPVTSTETVIATAGAPGKLHVPASGALGTTWTGQAFNDSGWAPVETGIGYDAPVPPVAGYGDVYADSVTEFSGTQGQNGWSYGYWNRTLDADGLYQPGDVTPFTAAQWTGTIWDLAPAAPWTEISATGGHPNGTNNGQEHWTVRRWVSEFTGRARFVGTINDGGEGGDGVGLRVYVEGVQVFNRTTFSAVPLEFVVDADVQTGQRVDFVVTPLANDGSDGHAFNVKVYNGALADSVTDWSAGGVVSSRRWTYGYYRRSGDADGIYQTANFVQFPRIAGNNTVTDGTNAWNGANWQLSTTAPFLTLTPTGGTPTVTTNQDWPIRRWTSSYTGRVRIAGATGHINAGSNGVIARIYLNGAQIYSKTVNNVNEGYSLVADVTNGSILDFAIDPNGTDAGPDTDSIFTALISEATIGATVAADSIANYGTGAQGTNGWSHGYYNKTTDANAVYDAADFSTTDPNWALSGTTWVLGPADPPWTNLHVRGGHPNSTNNGGEHWSIHRWTSTVTGMLTVDWNLAKGGAGGTGTTVKVFHNGVEKGSFAISGTDRVGYTRSAVLSGVAIGDKIDIALTPVGLTGAPDDGADSSWFSARILNNTLPANTTLTQQADSVADWSTSGTQGFRGWSYGYYNKTTDADGVYQTANLTAFLNDGTNVVSGTNNWNGGAWDLNPAASGPWTELGQTACHPNGTNSAPNQEHWCIRRWTTTVSGPLSIAYKVWKTNPNGGGVTIQAFHNGTLMDTVAIPGSDTTGVTRSFYVPSANVGDIIDVALTPVGSAGGTDDGSDGSAYTATISRVTNFSDNIDASAGNVQSAMYGVNASVYLRVPVTAPATAFDTLKLRMKYDDGFVAYLNGTEVTRRNVPVAAVGGFFANSLTEFSGVQGQNNWFYGYWNKTTDANGTYERDDFATSGGNWGYTPSVWAFSPANPPWTSIDTSGGHPNGTNSAGGVHHTVRRWVAETAGTVTARVRIFKVNAACGTGTTGYLRHNGRLVWSQVVAGNDSVGFTADVTVPDVQINDSLDLELDATGVGGDTTDGCDSTHLSMSVEQQPSAGLTWNSAATDARASSLSGTFEDFDITANRFLLTPGSNVLAFHGLNASAADPDFLLLPELVGTVISVDPAGRVYFTSPTPGTINGGGSTTIGPLVTAVTDSPAVTDADNIVVTARVRPTIDPVNTVTLSYRIMYGPESSLPMFDDGAHGDGPASDQVYGATIPASASTPGQMVRWRIQATDSSNDLTKSPPYANPTNSPEYWGTVVTVANPVSGGQLPVLHWFTNNTGAHDGTGGGRCSIFFNGEFFDNVGADLHGQSSTGFPKKSYDFDLNSGFKMEWDPTPDNTTPRVNSFNLLTTYPDKANLRNILAYRTFAAAGVHGHWAQAVQVRRNNAFYSVAHMVEDGDADFLERAPGMDDQGALYKMYNTFFDPAGGEKKTRKWEGNADLAAFMAGLAGTGVTKERFLYDNAGVPETLNYLAANAMTGNDDCCHKNYYVYRDSEGNREWRPLPWDVDLSYGRVWRSAETYFRDTMTYDTSLFVGTGNQFMTTFMDGTYPNFRAMYLRRLRTLADTILNPSSMPVANRWVENQLNILQPLIQPEADYERTQGLWGTWGTPQTMTQAVDIIRNDYLPPRRNYVFSQSFLPPSQNPLVTVNFGTVVFDPATHNQAEEYFTLTNPNAVAVDVSNWVISGAVEHILKPGTVIPAAGTLYLSPDVNAFRARATSPKGNEGLFIQGNYNGQLSARGETLTLMDGTRTVATVTYTGTPSAAQNFLRVTEMMYNPGAKPGDTLNSEEYEFIELKNISSAVPIPLTGVKFSNGIDFTFAGGSLAPGATAILVRDAVAFAERHPSVTIAGTYTGNLDNGGERVVLLDANNEEVLDYSYEDDWYPATDGGGFSLVCASESQVPDLWTLKIGWKPSGTVGGTPGGADAITDTDHDGYSDYEEWLAGTDPYFAQSLFGITPTSFTGGIVSGSFEGVAGKTYTLQYSDTLQPGSWQKLTDFTPAASGPITFSDTPPPAVQRRCYRIVTPAVP